MSHSIESRLPLEYIRQTPQVSETVKRRKLTDIERKQLSAGFADRMNKVFPGRYQKEIAEALNLNRDNVADLIFGRSLPSFETLISFNGRVNLNWLMRGIGAPQVGFELQIPGELRAKLERRAEASGVNLHDEIISLIEKQLRVIEIVEG